MTDPNRDERVRQALIDHGIALDTTFQNYNTGTWIAEGRDISNEAGPVLIKCNALGRVSIFRLHSSIMLKSGMTLVSVLVALGIMVLLAAIATPVLIRSLRQADRVAELMHLNTISVALNAYKNDMGDYPRVPDGSAGDTVLYRALAVPFKLRPTAGRTYGPYINPDKFKLDTVNSTILDRRGNPVLYYPNSGTLLYVHTDPSTTTPPETYVRLQTGTPESRCLFDSTDNPQMSPLAFAVMLGDSNPNGTLETFAPYDERALAKAAFVLISAGPDGRFGPRTALAGVTPASPANVAQANAVRNRETVANCDDLVHGRD
jgi:type II secretory pathway pseudopilin PulG